MIYKKLLRMPKSLMLTEVYQRPADSNRDENIPISEKIPATIKKPIIVFAVFFASSTSLMPNPIFSPR